MTRLEHAVVFGAGLIALAAIGVGIFTLLYPDRALTVGKRARQPADRQDGDAS